MFCVTVGSSTSKAEPKNCVAKVIGKPATATIVWIAVSGNHRWRGGRCVANHAHHIIHSALTGSRSPAGPRRLGTATRISASLFRRLSAFFGSTPDQAPKAAKLAVLIPGPGMLVNVRNAPRVVIPPPSETPPVSACKPLCAILLRKPSVYPLSPVKANVGRLCERLKNAMKSGLGRSCSGNFLAIFAGTVLSEKSNFTGRFFEWRRPFDFSTR